MIVDVEEYFSKGCGRCARFDTHDCATRTWAAGLRDLRALCLGAGLSEHVKWGHPCYMAHDRNIAIIGALRDGIRLTFMNAALLKDQAGMLTPAGPNATGREVWRFSSDGEVAAHADTIAAYLREAVGHAARGTKAPKAVRDDPRPDELADALDADPELAQSFHALTPGRQRSYLINLNSAKRPETRISRIDKFRPKILAGKGALER